MTKIKLSILLESLLLGHQKGIKITSEKFIHVHVGLVSNGTQQIKSFFPSYLSTGIKKYNCPFIDRKTNMLNFYG